MKNAETLSSFRPLVGMWRACRALWFRCQFWTLSQACHAAYTFPNLDWMTLRLPEHVLDKIIRFHLDSCLGSFKGHKVGEKELVYWTKLRQNR